MKNPTQKASNCRKLRCNNPFFQGAYFRQDEVDNLARQAQVCLPQHILELVVPQATDAFLVGLQQVPARLMFRTQERSESNIGLLHSCYRNQRECFLATARALQQSTTSFPACAKLKVPQSSCCTPLPSSFAMAPLYLSERIKHSVLHLLLGQAVERVCLCFLLHSSRILQGVGVRKASISETGGVV